MDGARVRVEVLGPFRVRGPDADEQLGGGLAAALVAILALRLGQPVDRDDLIASLWATPRDDAGPALRQLVARARRVLPDGAIERVDSRGRTSYRLSPAHVTVDLFDFDRRCDEARVADGFDRTAIRDALALVSGTPLSGLPDLEVFDDVRRSVDAHVAELRRALLIADAEDRQPSLVPALETALEHTRDDEGLWTAAVRYLARTGRPAAAARTAVRARHHLGEVGIEPGPALRDAERLAFDLGSMTPCSLPTLPMPPDIVGRLAERTEALTNLTAGPDRLVTLWGAPGMGASSLLVAVANDAAAAGLTVAFVATPSAARPRSAGELVEELASRLGWAGQDGDPVRWMSVVAPPGAVLALDLCLAPDHVAEAIGSVRVGWPGPLVVATGRPMGIPGEHPVRLGALGRADAAELLRRRTEALRGRPITGPELAALVEVSERSGGIPLVIELVSRQLATCSAIDLAAGPVASGLSERVESIVATLTDDVRAVLDRIAWIGGPFDLVDACRMFPRPRPGVDVVRGALAALVEVGLVQFEEERPTSAYRMLAPIVAVVRESESARAVRRSSTQRRTVTLAGRGRVWGDALGRVDHDRLVRPMLLDRLPELVAAARDETNPSAVRRALLRASTELMFAVGRAPEAQRILDQVVRSEADVERFALDLVRTAYYLDDPVRVVDLVDRTRTLSLPDCDRITVERAAVRSLRHMCRFAEAHELLDRLDRIVDPTDRVDPVSLRTERGMVLTLEDRCDEATELLAEARVDWRALDADQAVGACDVYLSWCAWAQGAPDRAEELLHRSADVARRIGHDADVMFCRATAARFAVEQGRFEHALAECREVEAYMRSAGDQLGLARLLETRAAAERGLGRNDDDAAFEAALVRRRIHAPVSPFERRFTGGERLLTIAGL